MFDEMNLAKTIPLNTLSGKKRASMMQDSKINSIDQESKVTLKTSVVF